MKITISELRKLIKEEASRMHKIALLKEEKLKRLFKKRERIEKQILVLDKDALMNYKIKNE